MKLKFFGAKKKNSKFKWKWSKEKKAYFGSLGVLAFSAGIAGIVHFAQSDEFDHIMGSDDTAQTCDITINLAESLKNRLFTPYRPELQVIQQDQVSSAVRVLMQFEKHIERSEWEEIARGAGDLRR